MAGVLRRKPDRLKIKHVIFFNHSRNLRIALLMLSSGGTLSKLGANAQDIEEAIKKCEIATILLLRNCAFISTHKVIPVAPPINFEDNRQPLKSYSQKDVGMSEIGKLKLFTPVSAQPPLCWYFDPQVLDIEQRVLFDVGPKYVGHELMVPNLGDYHVVEWMDNAKMLVRNDNGVELLSNICRHRQATMLEGQGNAKNIVCPLHRWTYKTNGELLGAPLFPNNPCLHLHKTPLQNWNGLLFAGQRDIAKDLATVPAFAEINFSGFMLDRVEVDEYNFNWKTFIEVYQEDYHVAPFHPGLGQFVNCDDLAWDFGEHYSVQTVGINDQLRKPGSEVYAKWAEQVLRYNKGQIPKYGAIWLTYYPNIMVEWYPNTLVVSTIVPRGTDACTNIVEFYYPEDIVLFEREYIETEKQAYRETALEDDIICLRMHQGRRALYKQGIEEVGPYQSPTEDGMLHFHEFLRRNLEPLI